jgi:glucose-1-phosphate thymidylyltransferase
MAIILAGGFAKRLWPLTLNKPKPLLPIAGRPALDYILEKILVLKPSIDKILISTSSKFEEQFKEWSSKYRDQRVEIVPDGSWREEDKPGAIGALASLSNMINEDVLVVGGDNLFTDDLAPFLAFFKEKRASTVGVYRAANAEQVKRGSAVIIDGEGKIVSFLEKPNTVHTSLVGAVIYAFPEKVCDWLNEYARLKLPRDEPGRFIEWLHKKEQVYAYMLKNMVWDFGTLESYKQINHLLSSKNLK